MPTAQKSTRYLRRSAVRAWLGIGDAELTKLIDAGIVEQFYFQGTGRAYYSRAQILRAERTGKIFKPKTQTILATKSHKNHPANERHDAPIGAREMLSC